MQQIERYGVIALVFLLVTIVAVSFWGDSKSPGFWARLTGRAKKAEVAQVETQPDPLAAPVASGAPGATAVPAVPIGGAENAVDGALPLSATGVNTFVAIEGTPAPSATPATDFALPAAQPVPVNEALVTAPAPPTAPAGPVYVVRKDDSLGSIAQRTLGSAGRWPEIQALNGGIEPKSLRIGMKLVLPASASLAGSSPSAKPPPAKKSAPKESPKAGTTSGAATYVVQKGDSLSSIAMRKLGDSDRWKDILALNPGLDPKRLLAGRTIRIPAEKGAALVASAMPAPTASADRPRVR